MRFELTLSAFESPVETSEESGGESGERGGGETVQTAYNPVGRTVAEVTAYMAENPSEIDAIKAAEGNTAIPRKGIMEFTG